GPQRPLGGDVNDVGVARVDEDAGQVLGVAQADVLPGGAAVGALVKAVAEADAALRLVLAAAEPDDVGVLRIDDDAAERVGAVVVEDRFPGQAAVGRLPEAAGGRRDVPDAAVARVHGDVGDAPGRQGWADGTQRQGAAGFRGQRRRLLRAESRT